MPQNLSQVTFQTAACNMTDVMGRGLELHAVTVLLVLAFWGLLWGIIGMVLVVPIVAMLRIGLSRFATTRPLGELLAGRLPGTEPANHTLRFASIEDDGQLVGRPGSEKLRRRPGSLERFIEQELDPKNRGTEG
jgi:hypothetical protein